ncbi:hypothetical protein O9929_20005 [Vibrio lentus]|nr:hypothetical protein [Vibrio lentus]
MISVYMIEHCTDLGQHLHATELHHDHGCGWLAAVSVRDCIRQRQSLYG